MTWKSWLLGAVVAAALVVAESPRGMIVALSEIGMLALVAMVIAGAWSAVTRPGVRRPMVVSSLVVTLGMTLAAAPWVPQEGRFLLVFAGFPGLVVGLFVYFLSMVVAPDLAERIDVLIAGLVLGVYWLVNTAVVGALLAVLHRGNRARAAT